MRKGFANTKLPWADSAIRIKMNSLHLWYSHLPLASTLKSVLMSICQSITASIRLKFNFRLNLSSINCKTLGTPLEKVHEIVVDQINLHLRNSFAWYLEDVRIDKKNHFKHYWHYWEIILGSLFDSAKLSANTIMQDYPFCAFENESTKNALKIIHFTRLFFSYKVWTTSFKWPSREVQQTYFTIP